MTFICWYRRELFGLIGLIYNFNNKFRERLWQMKSWCDDRSTRVRNRWPCLLLLHLPLLTLRRPLLKWPMHLAADPVDDSWCAHSVAHRRPGHRSSNVDDVDFCDDDHFAISHAMTVKTMDDRRWPSIRLYCCCPSIVGCCRTATDRNPPSWRNWVIYTWDKGSPWMANGNPCWSWRRWRDSGNCWRILTKGKVTTTNEEWPTTPSGGSWTDAQGPARKTGTSTTWTRSWWSPTSSTPVN